MRQKLSALLLLTGITAVAQENTELPIKSPRQLLMAEIGLIRASIGAERALSDRFYLKVTGGIGLNHLATEDVIYPRYKEYLNSTPPSYEDHSFVNLGDVWWSLNVSSEIRYYLLSVSRNANPDLLHGVYVGILYRFAGREFGIRETTESHWSLFSPSYTTKLTSRYRPTHRTGFVLGFQSFTGKRKRGLVDFSTGVCTLWNYNFSQATVMPYLNISFAFLMRRS